MSQRKTLSQLAEYLKYVHEQRKKEYEDNMYRMLPASKVPKDHEIEPQTTYFYLTDDNVLHYAMINAEGKIERNVFQCDLYKLHDTHIKDMYEAIKEDHKVLRLGVKIILRGIADVNPNHIMQSERKKSTVMLQNLITQLEQGHCFAFSLIYGAMRVINKLPWWLALLNQINQWDGDPVSLTNQYKLPGSQQEESLQALIERAIHYIVFYQVNEHPVIQLQGLSQRTIIQANNPYFEIINENNEILSIKQFKTTGGHFTREELSNRLTEKRLSHDNVCLVFSSSHALCFYYDEVTQLWYAFDPNDTIDVNFQRSFSEKDLFLQEIFNILGHSINICVLSFKKQPLLDDFNEPLTLDQLKQYGLGMLLDNIDENNIVHIFDDVINVMKKASENDPESIKAILSAKNQHKNNVLSIIMKQEKILPRQLIAILDLIASVNHQSRFLTDMLTMPIHDTHGIAVTTLLHELVFTPDTIWMKAIKLIGQSHDHLSLIYALLNKNNYKNTVIDLLNPMQKEELSIYLKDEYKMTDLHIALLFGNKTEAIKIMKETNAVKINAEDKFGITPFYIAMMKKQTDMSTLLLDTIKNKSIQQPATNRSALFVQTSLLHVKLLAQSDPTTLTVAKALHFAIENNDFNMAEALIHSTDHDIVNVAVDQCGMTALHKTLMNTCPPLSFVKQLIDKKIDLNKKSNNGSTVLHYVLSDLATLKNKYDVIALLLQEGADITVKNNFNQSPLDFLMESQDINLIKEFHCQICHIHSKLMTEDELNAFFQQKVDMINNNEAKQDLLEFIGGKTPTITPRIIMHSN